MIKKGFCMKHIPSSLELGYTIIRIALGIVLVVSGYNKLSFALTQNTDHLIEIGSTMSLFGITYGYLWWGYVAAFTEFFGGIAFIGEFLTRLAAIPLIFLFIVAIKFHLHKGDPFAVWGFAFICLSICIGVLIAGKGDDKHSVNYKTHE